MNIKLNLRGENNRCISLKTKVANKQFSVQCACNVDAWGNHMELEILGLFSSNVLRNLKVKKQQHPVDPEF